MISKILISSIIIIIIIIIIFYYLNNKNKTVVKIDHQNKQTTHIDNDDPIQWIYKTSETCKENSEMCGLYRHLRYER